MAHELTHVVQQANGLQRKLENNEPCDQYEREADRVALGIGQATPFVISRQADATLMCQFDEPQAEELKASESDVKELKDKVSKLVKSQFGGDYRKAFDYYDVDHDGGVNAAEVRKLLEDAGVGNRLTRGRWVAGILEQLDTNRNGKIEWKEFQDGII